MSPLPLRLLGRAECELCHEMRDALLADPRAAGLQLVEVEVDDDPRLVRRYGLRVPVLLDPWGDVICEGRFDATAFADWLAEEQARHPHGA